MSIDIRYIEITSCENCPHRRHFEGVGRASAFDTCAHPRVVKAYGEAPFARKLTNFPFFPDFCPLRGLQEIVVDRHSHGNN
jgi:hypothetical protein